MAFSGGLLCFIISRQVLPDDIIFCLPIKFTWHGLQLILVLQFLLNNTRAEVSCFSVIPSIITSDMIIILMKCRFMMNNDHESLIV